MKEILNYLRKYKIAIITAFMIILIGIIILVIFKGRIKIKEFSNEYYSFSYDTSWNIKKVTNDTINLKHSSGSILNIEIVDLKDEYKYSTIEDILDEFLFNVENQNESYKLLAKEKCKMTKSEYDGFKLLYENGSSQALIYVCKISDKLIIFNFESDNSRFDILLDSVQNIIYNFNISENKFELSYKINVDTTEKLKYSENKELDKVDEISEYEIADKNYIVNYSIPSRFELSDFNSQDNYFNYRGNEDGSMTLTTHIFNKNIYEYLEKDKNIGTIYSDNNNIRKGDDPDYLDFKEDLSEIKGEKEGYIYKASYTYKGVMSDTKYENIIIAYVLDKNHLFLIELESRNLAISENFINNITMDSFKNYSSYIKRNIEDGNVIGNLKRYTDSDRTKYDNIKVKLPEKYTELDKGYNIYKDRFYCTDYNEDKEIWKYQINYKLTNTIRDLDSQIEFQSSSYKTGYGEYKELTYTKDIDLNGKKFKVYDGMYTDITDSLFDREKFIVDVKALFYGLDNGGYVVIEVRGNGVEISDDILREVTNFDIEKREI